jgi:hypothetical protein
MKTKLACFSLFLLISAQAVWASHTSMIGGARDGLGLGMETRRDFGWLTGRFGVEATTGEDLTFSGDNPFLIYAGGLFPLLKDKPVSGSLGFVGYFGNRSEQGAYGSLIIDKFNGNDATYAETGLDWFGDHGHVFLQIGYRFLPLNY